jgi:hypothetical protein
MEPSGGGARDAKTDEAVVVAPETNSLPNREFTRRVLLVPRNISRNGAVSSLFGASLLSSAGSLPLHLVPLIVVALIADSRTSVAGAGWVASAILFGQLSTALLLPALGIQSVRRAYVFGAAVILTVGVAISSAAEYLVVLTGWFLVGQCCGVFSYLGTVVAAQFSRPVFAFSLRLGIVLIFAGCVSGVLQLFGMLASYRDLLTVVAGALIPMVACGTALHHPISVQEGYVYQATQRLKVGSFAGLLTVYLFFVGQTGYLSYAVQQAVGRGMTFESTALSLALMKISAGIWVLCTSCVGHDDLKSTRFGYLTVVLIIAIIALFYSKHIVVFFLALLAIEMALNRLSARLQAAVVAARPKFAGRWLTGIMLLGAASGPPLNGFMISIGLDGAFVLICVFSALGPLLWQQWSVYRVDMVESVRT